MDVKSALKQSTFIDPYSLFKSADMPKLVIALEAILNDKNEVEALKSDPSYLENASRAIRYVYLKTLNMKTEFEASVAKPRYTDLLSNSALNTLYALTS